MKKFGLFVFFFLLTCGGLVGLRNYHADGGALHPDLEMGLIEIGLLDPPPPPPLRDYTSPEEELADVMQRLGEYQRELDTRIATLQTRRREKDLSRKILLQQGKTEDDPVFDAMDQDLVRIDQSLAVLSEFKLEASDVEEQLRRIVDATASVDEMYVDDNGSLFAARSVLTRIEQQGLILGD